jgi:hypothetical protein
MARKIEGNDLAIGQQRREQIERARVIEPAVQSEQRHAAAATPDLRREREPGQNEFPLIWHREMIAAKRRLEGMD